MQQHAALAAAVLLAAWSRPSEGFLARAPLFSGAPRVAQRGERWGAQEAGTRRAARCTPASRGRLWATQSAPAEDEGAAAQATEPAAAVTAVDASQDTEAATVGAAAEAEEGGLTAAVQAMLDGDDGAERGGEAAVEAPEPARRAEPPPPPPILEEGERFRVVIGEEGEGPGAGPGGNKGVSKLVVRVGDREVSMETGRMGRLAHGAVMSRDGDTVLYTTACADNGPSPLDFSPLRVDYMERFSAAGLTSGGYNKRDGRMSEKEILVSRLMDRPLRPMLHKGWTHETQVLTWVLSYDSVRPPEPLAITSASAALVLSHIPLVRPVAGVQVAMDPQGSFVVNPDKELAELSRLNLTMAGSENGILMIEGECDFLTEEQMVNAIQVGHEAIKNLCQGMEAWAKAVGQEKKTDTLRETPEGLKAALEALLLDDIDAALHVEDKKQQGCQMTDVYERARAVLAWEEEPAAGEANDLYDPLDVKLTLKDLWSERLRHMVRTEGRRCDNRRPDEVRPISIETTVLPRTHGSSLFTRGETQSLATVTLGGSSSQQKLDSIGGMTAKSFYLQYTFPPSCVGETGRNGAPGRREIGHGNLAERALAPAMPSMDDFPYSVRVESLITESCGSSSMASVCGGCLSLMDAGVPIKSKVAGVAMGLLLDESGSDGDEGAVILTDILGLEDALGTMDFKVAGDKDGITSFQLDIKCEGLTVDLLRRAMAQAKQGRLHILGKMEEAMPAPRESLSPYVPVAGVMRVDPELIGRIIGPGGKIIRQIMEDFTLETMDVDDDGRVFLSSFNQTGVARAKKFVESMLKDDPVAKRGGKRQGMENIDFTQYIGQTFRECAVTGVHVFGCFVEFIPGVDGLVHVSELDSSRVVSVEAMVKEGDKLDVKVLGVDERTKKIRLSRKAVLLEDNKGKGGSATGLKEKNSSAPPRPRAPARAIPLTPGRAPGPLPTKTTSTTTTTTTSKTDTTGGAS